MQAAPDFSTFFSTGELAKMLGISRQAVRQKADGKRWKPVARKGQGGGLCWLFSDLDEQTRNRVSHCWHKQWKRQQQAMKPEDLEREKVRLQIMEEQFFRKPGKAQSRAERRYRLLLEAMELIDGGMKVLEAFAIVAKNNGVKAANLRNWYYGTDKKPGVRKLPRHEWLYALMDHYVGRQAERKRTHFGNAEINKMMRGTAPDTHAQSVENMNRRTAALG